MTLDQFQQQCLTTNKYQPSEMLTCCTLGAASEAGEIAGKLDKWIRKNHNTQLSPEYAHEMALEVFDNLWFLAGVASALGIPFSQIAEMGLQKLQSRDMRNKIISLEGGDNR